jgi:protein gp37
MANTHTGIEWTDASWNPTTGCTEVSSGCDHCYARTLAMGKLRDAYSRRLPVVLSNANVNDPFAVRLWPERLDQPARWREPRRIFVNSMSDLFHVDVPDEFVRQVFEAMLTVDRHVYQVLTKRPGRMARFVRRNRDLFGVRVPAHIWVGTSVENQETAFRVGQLRDVPAAVRFLSCEPLLGPLDLQADLWGPYVRREEIHWVIVGGESGAGARKMDPEWARSLRDQCLRAGVPFLFKQWGGHTPKAGGRELDGRTWDEFPEVVRI